MGKQQMGQHEKEGASGDDMVSGSAGENKQYGASGIEYLDHAFKCFCKLCSQDTCDKTNSISSMV